MMFKWKQAMAVAGIGMSLTGASVMAFEKPSDAIDYRQSVFSLVAHHTAEMGAMVKGEKPYDAQQFQYRAAAVAALAEMPLEGFEAKGSESGDTKAKPAVWKDWDAFEEKMAAFQKDASALDLAAKAGDKKDTQRAFVTMAKNCKSCHSDFKNR